MKKDVVGAEVYYRLEWSPFFRYDKHQASRIMPNLPGIIGLYTRNQSVFAPVLFFECWRDGVRDGMKNFLDPLYFRFRDIRGMIDMEDIWISFTIVESSPQDLKDILFFLIKAHTPRFNNAESFGDSRRYRSINIKETRMEGFDFSARLR
jgi:hypothetical protein